MKQPRMVARLLAASFAAGALTEADLIERGYVALGHRPAWLRRLAKRLSERYNRQLRPQAIEIEDWIFADRGFRAAAKKKKLQLREVLAPRPEMVSSSPYASSASVPAIVTPGELADWLYLSSGELSWFADLHNREARQPSQRLRHYQYRLVSKQFGRARLIESPKPRLKEIQTRILREILDRVEPHQAAHGFRRSRSTATFARPHLDQAMVLRIDLEDFFPTVSRRRVQAVFRLLGYPPEVARLLAGLTTNTANSSHWILADPFDALSPKFAARGLYLQPHLPQGAPTSPSLANLVAYRCDHRLDRLARSANAIYTRYADDLAFSGDQRFARGCARFSHWVTSIVSDEGFRINYHKTKMMAASGRQELAGLVVNKRLNVKRDEFDRLKALLYNCRKSGPASQNVSQLPHFQSFVNGKLSYLEMIHPQRAQKLRRIYDQIDWGDQV